jgi:hypothetical protein
MNGGRKVLQQAGSGCYYLQNWGGFSFLVTWYPVDILLTIKMVLEQYLPDLLALSHTRNLFKTA